jgi:2-oxoglutarate ferredoxin oxidoreductase subunit alpha
MRAKYLVDCIGINKVQGKPFTVHELVDEIKAHAEPIQAEAMHHKAS